MKVLLILFTLISLASCQFGGFGQLAQSIGQQAGNIGQQVGQFGQQAGQFGQQAAQQIGGQIGQIGGQIGQIGGNIGLKPITSLTEGAENVLQQSWSDFKQLFNKTYSSVQEEVFRREYFIENFRKIEAFNKEFSVKARSFAVQLNGFADMLFHEFHKSFNGFSTKKGNRTRIVSGASTTFVPSANVAIPERVDWRELGAVTSVKNQLLCAGCWAFAAAGALEGQHFRKTGQLIDLSPQNLIDCCFPYDNDGCDGGLIDPAYQYVKDNNGIDAEGQYPYEARNGQCRFQRQEAETCTGFVDIPSGSEAALEAAVATIGPIAAAINAGLDSFQFYREGVYFEEECGNTEDDINHAVLVVGYGSDPDGQQYWIIKNSYGPGWGVGGYMKLAKNRNNHCGIATLASYPLV